MPTAETTSPGNAAGVGAQLWGGVFEGAADPLFRAFNDSLPFDWALVREDIAGSSAWARALERAGVLTPGERADLERALDELLAEAEAIGPRAPADSGAEDVHSWVEQRLIERLGALGKKLHTGRSRNDQVATDLRLWTRARIDARIGEIREVQRALLRLAERELDAPLPGYTHLQRAQPVVWGHWALAYAEMLDRDADRFADARRRLNRCPLGSAALAGTAYPIDREALARDLGFDGPTANSLDAVSDRDFALETLAAAALCAAHLSRIAEELILYATGEFGFIALDDSVASGSSIMPQKKNPDALELLRGKAGRIFAAHTNLLVTVKGLPLAYNKDLQEDKEPLFDSMAHLSLCLRMLARVLDATTVRRDRCRAAALGGYSNATELADYLVGKGVPFRDAHEVSGRAVRRAIALGVPLDELPLEELRGLHERIGEDVYPAIALEATLARRDVPGGTAPARVREAVADLRRRLEQDAAS